MNCFLSLFLHWMFVEIAAFPPNFPFEFIKIQKWFFLFNKLIIIYVLWAERITNLLPWNSWCLMHQTAVGRKTMVMLQHRSYVMDSTCANLQVRITVHLKCLYCSLKSYIRCQILFSISVYGRIVFLLFLPLAILLQWTWRS